MMKRYRLSFILIAMMAFMTHLAVAQTFTYPSRGKQGFQVAEKTRDGLRVSYNLDHFSLIPVDHRGEAMSEINFTGITLPNREGCPNLPVETRLMAVPQGAKATLEVVRFEKEVIKDVNIAPALRIQAENEVPERNYVKDMRVYIENALYPAEPFHVEAVSIRGVDAVAVSVSPFQYNPVTKELVVYTQLELSLRFEGGNGHFGDDALRSPYWDPILAAELMNYDQLPRIDYAARMQQWLRDGVEGAEYLIITPNNDAWAEYANQLRDYRLRQGIVTKVFRLDEIPASTTDELKAWFHNAYNTWTIRPAAVLLFGDHNEDMSQGIPAEYTYHSSDYGYCVTDNGYADPNGDLLPDMAFSRLVAANAAEAQMMVSKQLEYEYTNPNMDASTYDHPITALGWQTERWFQICSEVVGGYWRNQGKHPVRINEIYDGTPEDVWSSQSGAPAVVEYFGPNGQGYLPASPAELGGWTGGTGAQVVEAVNSGSMLLQHRDHGYYRGWGEPSFSNNHVNQMTNVGKLTFVNTINCQTGTFDYSSDCLIEAFMRRTYNGQNAGAVGCIGPTQVSYSYVNDVFAWGLYDQYDPNFIPDYGPYADYEGNWRPAFGNVAGKYFLEQCAWVSGYGAKEITYKMFTAHCDAFLQLYTQVPRTMTVAHTANLYASSTSMSVTAPQGCMISLVKQSWTGEWEILAVAAATGSAQNIPFEAQAPQTVVHLVITGQDYLRYEDTLTVIPSAGAYLSVCGFTPTTIQAGQLTSFGITLKNVGLSATTGTTTITLACDDPRLTFTDNSAQTGVLAANQTVTLSNAFSFGVNQTVDDNTPFQINVTMTCNGQVWTDKVFVTAVKAVMGYEGMTWQGGFSPGETFNITASFKNRGHHAATNAVVQLSTASPLLTIHTQSCNLGTICVNEEAQCLFSVTVSSTCDEADQIPITFLLSANNGISLEVTEVLKNTCALQFILHDSFGDGWNGNVLNVSFSDGSPTEQLTIEYGNSATYTLLIGESVHVTLTWTMGSWTSECSFEVRYENDFLLYQATEFNADFLYEFDLHCSDQYAPFSITVSADPPEGGTAMGGGTFNAGQTVNLSATANPSYLFYRWTLNGTVVSCLSDHTVTATDPCEYVAQFTKTEPNIGIGGAGMANTYLPSYSYFNYSLTQQIYTSAEMGDACKLGGVSFFNIGPEKTRDYTIYLVNTDKSSFDNSNDWIPVTEADQVFSGSVIMTSQNWTKIVFDTPFVYDGTSNVALIIDDNSGNWTSNHANYRVFETESCQTLRVYSDYDNYDPMNPSGYGGTQMWVKNQVIFELQKETLQIGEGEDVNQYLPSYSFYNYTLSQQLYTAAEIGTACSIMSVAFFNGGSTKTRSYDLYLAHTSKSSFENNTDWIPVTEADRVFSGTVEMAANGWTTITFDRPFVYNGRSNLALIVDDNTESWSSGMQCRVFNTGGSQAIRVYSDYTDFDPGNPSAYDGTLHSVKNQIILEVIVSNAFSEQTFQLTPGWNWWSSFLMLEGPEGLETLKETLGDNCLQIKSQNNYLTHSGGQWIGGLTSLENVTMFMIETAGSGTYTLEGLPADPTQHVITLQTGWNWIGFPVSQPMSLSEAFALFTPSEGDMVKSSSGYAYYENGAWHGSLSALQPGRGYMYYANSPVTFTYPSSY